MPDKNQDVVDLKIMLARIEERFDALDKKVDKIHDPDQCPGLKRHEQTHKDQATRDRVILGFVALVWGAVVTVINYFK